MEAFVGQISVFGFGFAPYKWATCSGQIMPISQNAALFSLLGTFYGGNGTSNFGLPNLSGTVAIGKGQSIGGSFYDLGETGGTSTVALSREQTPAHTHSVMGSISVADSNTAAGNVLGRSQGTANPKAPEGKIYNPNTADTVIDAPLAPIGGGQMHDNTQPYLALTYCICINGIFPQRG
ncbi:MAG TPA: tail fiber protein [Reyranella sp.]|jgi:microcystin-dependent protein